MSRFRWRPRSLGEWILVSLASGVLCGLFFGEMAGRLQVLGDAYLGLLQMTVLPYIILSLIGGIGRLNMKQARRLGGAAVLVLLSFWGVSLATVAGFQLALPKVRSPSFFSTALVEGPAPFDFLAFLVPANPFQALAETRVPMHLSDPHLFVTMALVVPDHRDREFSTIDSIRRMESLRIGVISDGWFGDKVRTHLPDAEVVVLGSEREFFEGRGAGEGLDALLYSAEAGAAWTLIYPGFQVATPLPTVISVPLVYPFALRNDPDLDEFLDHWVLLKTRDGTLQGLYDHWILGQGSQAKTPRWSVVRDVLHLVD